MEEIRNAPYSPATKKIPNAQANIKKCFKQTYQTRQK